LRGNEALTTTLSAVTAAVVGGLAAFVAMIKWKLDIIPVVLGAGLLGLIFKILF
jgi:hypothetical protein